MKNGRPFGNIWAGEYDDVVRAKQAQNRRDFAKMDFSKMSDVDDKEFEEKLRCRAQYY